MDLMILKKLSDMLIERKISNMVIVALDFESKEKALEFLSQFKNESLYVKCGMELFYSEGPSIISEIKKLGHKVFLDLKLHDIPNTVKSAMKRLATLGVDIVNVHAAGGIKMMKAAMEAFEGMENRPNIIIKGESIKIGQGNDADEVINKDTISHFHAIINKENKEFYLEDLNSTNGTFVNDEILPYKQKKQLKINDIVRFADVKYRFV